MDAIKQLALELLETEKRFLLEDAGEYCAAIVVVITPERRYWEDVVFNTEDEKVEAYTAVVERAKERGAKAIITLNSGRQLDATSDEALDEYWWGKLAADGCSRTLIISASGPKMSAWCLTLPYSVENEGVSLGAASEFQPARVGLLPNWP